MLKETPCSSTDNKRKHTDAQVVPIKVKLINLILRCCKDKNIDLLACKLTRL